MNFENFFYLKSVFNKTEFISFMKENLKSDPDNYYLYLVYYSKKGKILKIRNGLYAVVPINSDKESFSPNSFLIAGKISEDSILSYYTAMEFYGISYSLLNLRTFLTNKKIKPFTFRGIKYKPITYSSSSKNHKRERFLTKKVDVSGDYISITNLERTFVDMLDKPNYCGGIEEVWESLKMIEYLDLKDVFEYLQLLRNATTNAKVGFFLEENKSKFQVNENFLNEIKKQIPKNIHYFDRGNRKNSKIIKKWNLAVPINLLKEGM